MPKPIPKPESLLSQARNYVGKRPKRCDDWPDELRAEIDDVLKAIIKGASGPGFALNFISTKVIERIKTSGLPEVHIQTCNRYLTERLKELRNAKAH